MMDFILGYLNYWLIAALFLVGLTGMLLHPNLMRKLMAMNILQVSVIFFFITVAAKTGGTPPILEEGLQNSTYVNPLPHALMLTAIVVGVATTGVALSLLIRLWRKYGTLDEREIRRKVSQ